MSVPAINPALQNPPVKLSLPPLQTPPDAGAPKTPDLPQQAPAVPAAATPVQNDSKPQSLPGFIPPKLGVLNPMIPSNYHEAAYINSQGDNYLPSANQDNPAAGSLLPAGGSFPVKSSSGILKLLFNLALLGGAVFLGKRFLNKNKLEFVTNFDNLKKYFDKVMQNPIIPAFQRVHIQLDENPLISGTDMKKDIVRKMLRITKKFSESSKNQEFIPVYHIVLKENARVDVEKVREYIINNSPELRKEVDKFDLVELVLEPRKYYENLLKDDHSVAINIGSYTYYDRRDGFIKNGWRIHKQRYPKT